MKIIDKKGKLFGLINVIDLLVILCVIAIIAVGAKRLKSSTTVGSVESKKGVVYAQISEVRKATVDGVKVGDPLYDYDKGTYIGKISKVDVEPFKKETEYQGKFYLAEVPEKYDVNIEIDVDVKETNDYYQVGTEQLRIGAQQRVKNKSIATFMVIMNVEVK